MKFIFLGTGGYHANDERHTAGLFVPELGLLFDAGTGLYRLRALLEVPHLDIVLSHAHLDHVIGLTYLLPLLNDNSLTQVRTLGTRQTLDTIDQHLFAEHLFPVRVSAESIAVDEADGDLPLLAAPFKSPLALRPFPLPKHRGGSTGYRLEGPFGSLAYVTDTAPDHSYLDAIRGVDVLVHECNFPDGREDWAETTGHCYLAHVLRLALEADAGRLILTHLDPTLGGPDPLGLEASAEMDLMAERNIPVEVAFDLMEFHVGEADEE